jgi:hypothetical protein
LVHIQQLIRNLSIVEKSVHIKTDIDARNNLLKPFKPTSTAELIFISASYFPPVDQF